MYVCMCVWARVKPHNIHLQYVPEYSDCKGSELSYECYFYCVNEREVCLYVAVILVCSIMAEWHRNFWITVVQHVFLYL